MTKNIRGMLKFTPGISSTDTSLDISSEIPKDLDIFYRGENAFLPEGKTIEELSDSELEELKRKYRFDPLKPGLYQSISGFKNMN